ncbi:peptidase M14 [bacterium SCSIO 12741]|nr:peptidase M14 [bacterium SCSIO 12741]
MPWQILDPASVSYSEYQHPAFPNRRFNCDHFYAQLNQVRAYKGFEVSFLGSSIEGRDIHAVRWGTGPIKVVLWSQMHGNESTATRAFFDLFEFLNKGSGCEQWSEQLSLVFIPVLNPDGLERFQRRNAWDIDLNRDAVSQSSPEIKILWETIKQEKADWCFNMHDQRNLFNVQGTSTPATIAFLSPSTGKPEFSQNQADAQMLIDQLNKDLQHRIPGAISRFTDEFYPSATGDNLQQQGYRTVLVESGGHRKDPERMVAREMNFWLLLHSFDLIASGKWHKGTRMGYGTIPENDQKMVDLMLRNVRIEHNGQSLVTDVGIEYKEVQISDNPEEFEIQAFVSQLGDLRHYHGYEEWDAEGQYTASPLKWQGQASFVLSGNNEKFVHVENGQIRYE